jgi:hypothetical protein
MLQDLTTSALFGKPPAPEEKPEDEAIDRQPLLDAAKDMIECVKDGDVEGLADALQAAFLWVDGNVPHKEAEPEGNGQE